MKLTCTALLALLFCGCVSETSLQHDPQFSGLMGARCSLPERTFLARSRDRYYITTDRNGYSHVPLPTQQRPTFAEWENGTWANQKSKAGPFDFLAILPTGQVIEVTDILREKHSETGVTYWLVGKLVDHPLAQAAQPIILNMSPKKAELLIEDRNWGFVRRQ